ncbi:MAG: hypothetical protein C0618_00400 [Desulfuromonas sp.]|nr:MAG: hypothetical protein C0618_00400 [Desulfuromonas sp.]
MRHKHCIIYLTVLLAWLCSSSVLFAQTVPWQLVMQIPTLESEVKAISPVFLGHDMEKKRYYVVDAGQGKLLSFDSNGQYLAAFDGGGQLQTPVAMARTSSGKFWIVERAENKLLYVNIREKSIRDFVLEDDASNRIVPGRIALDEKDRLYVQDRLSGSIVRLDDDLNMSARYAAPAGAKGLCDFKIKPSGLYALDCLEKKVYRFDSKGALKESVALQGNLLFPTALEIEGTDRFYILDRHAGKVAVYNRQGEHKFDFLSKGQAPGQVSYGAYLLLDWDNRLCVVEEGNGRVEIFARQ